MPAQKTPTTQSVAWREFNGDRVAIKTQLDNEAIPSSWGPAELVKQFIMQWVPEGRGWQGEIRVTGYRTPLNDNGTGTAYLSVHWEPRK